MSNSLKILLISICTLSLLSCVDDQHYKKGIDLYEAEKYNEAKTEFKLVKTNTRFYELADKYIIQVDSVILARKVNKLIEVDSALLNYKRMDFPQSIQDLTIEVAYFTVMGKAINDVKLLKLAEKQVHTQTLDSMLISIQVEQFPKLREEYGTILGKTLWKNDVDVSVSGYGSKNISFTSTAFTTNSNIDAFHKAIKESLYDFRFDQAIYTWRKLDPDPEILSIYSSEDKHIRVF